MQQIRLISYPKAIPITEAEKPVTHLFPSFPCSNKGVSIWFGYSQRDIHKSAGVSGKDAAA